MNTAEIVVSEMQSDSRFQMRQLFAERICEPRESPHRHPHGRVLPFHERRRDMLRIRIASSDSGYNPRDAWWEVPRFGSVELPIVPEHLDKLREISIQAEAGRNKAFVVIQPVGSNLRSAFDLDGDHVGIGKIG